MEAPECRVCGKKEWRHVCGMVVNEVLVVVNRRGRDRHRKDRREYMKEYMRRRRAKGG